MKAQHMKLLFAFCLTLLLCPYRLEANEPVIVGVNAVPQSSGVWTFHVSVKHADSGWDHYADNFEILSPDKKILATRILAHPHEHEQPFTRSQSGVKIPLSMTNVYVRAHDKVHGYGPSIVYKLP